MHPRNEPLFCSQYGQVTYCRYSSEFNLDFGGMRLWVGHERLRQLARRINGLIRTFHTQPPTVDQPIDFYLSGCDGSFRFYPDELLDLQTLIDGSLAMVDLYQFLDDHQFLLENNPFR